MKKNMWVFSDWSGICILMNYFFSGKAVIELNTGYEQSYYCQSNTPFDISFL
ncbi:hypothetical protein ACJX0J_039914, partial [Zea mays]